MAGQGEAACAGREPDRPIVLRGLSTVCLVLTTALVVSVGCSRSHHRARADRDAVRILSEKTDDPRWELPDLQVYPDERARFYDPYDPDHPPLPPDDPASHRYMHQVGGHKHYKKWHKDGDTPYVENPNWTDLLPDYVPVTDDGRVLLTMDSAAVLARMHSRNYQDNMEEVYLAALDVAFERFRFDVQFFGGTDTLLFARGNEPQAVLGRLNQPPAVPSRTILDHRTQAQINKRFATGADLLINFANSMVWNFAGDGSNFTTSLINFSFFQPFLRQGGREFVLEQLTRAERNLLSNVRAQAQFRQEFFKNVAVGGGTNVRPRRIGGFQGGAGLTGFTGTGAGGFGGVGAGFGTFGVGGIAGPAGAAAGAGFAGGGEGLVDGYLGLVQQLQVIRNTQASLAAQQLSLGILEANFEAGLIDLVQVDEFRQNIETERSNLLRNEVSLQDTLEVYLVRTLGLPPTLPTELDDSAIRPFQFIDVRLSESQNRATQLLAEIGELPESPRLDRLQTIKQELEQIVQTAIDELREVEQERFDFEAQDRDVRLETMNTQRERDEFLRDLERVNENLIALAGRIMANRDLLQQLQSMIAPNQAKEATDMLVELVRKVSSELQELSLLQARIRLEKITVPEIDLDPDAAFFIARSNRLDWMNTRAALVDQWRLITFNANRLKSDLSIEIEGDLGTVGNNPLRFRGPTGGLSARLQFDAPITRVSERNLYREALIEYQRSKRSYVQYVDGVAFTLRSRLRQINRLRMNLEIQRRALAIAIRRVDQTLEDLNRPTAPPQPGEQTTQLGPTIAQNLLRALSDLRNTQDNFTSVWLNYRQANMNLQFELGIIRFDENGVWIDMPIEEALAQAMQDCIPAETGTIDEYMNLLEDKVFEGYGDLEKEIENLPEEQLLVDGLPMPANAETGEEETAAKATDDGVIELQEVSAEQFEESDAQIADTSKDLTGPDGEKLRSSKSEEPNWRLDRLAKEKIGRLFAKEEKTREISQEEFEQNLVRVHRLREQGLNSEAIADETSIPLAEVLAYESALDRGRMKVLVALAREKSPTTR